jgi:predicted nucleic acid-binding protein
VTPLVIPDTCSILNFAVIGRVLLLTDLLAGRGRWTQAVRHEVDRHRGVLPGDYLADLRSALGTPLELTSVRDIIQVENVRRALGGTSRNPMAHLGEAESIHAILSVPDLKDAEMLTDDRFAAQVARQRDIRVISTPALLRTAHRKGILRCPEPYDLLVAMRARDRWVSIPPGHESICP